MKAKRLLSVLLILSIVFTLMCSVYTPVASAADTTLRFGQDGKFKILVFADCQDDDSPYRKMIELIEDALDNEKPDVVVFTGDNVVVSSESKFRTGAQKIIQPLIERGIPYAYTFGNHDDEYGVSKEYMHSVYSSLGTCLTYDADPSLNGFGNCNIPIYSSDGNDIAFNLWMIDSLTYGDGGYDHVRQDQIDWYKKTSLALEQQAGHKVNSIMFQHIALPEIYNLLTESSTGTKNYLGKKYSQNLNSNATGYLGEFPCPPAVNGGQFDALLERGDVLGVVTGHDHSNSFHGKYKGIGFLQMPGITFESYGDSKCRGYGVIELDESDTSTYSTHTVTYIDFWNGAAANSTWETSEYYGGAAEYIGEINFAAAATASSAKNELTQNGYTLIDKDLNADSGGNYIYLGYKTTTDPTKALRDIRYYVADSASSNETATVTVNGKECTYTRVGSVDLNKGAGGHYIYGYVSYDANAGLPVKAISFGSSPTSEYKVCGTLGSPYRAADLNADAGGEYIYCYLSTVTPIDVSVLKQKRDLAQEVLLNSEYYPESANVLKSTLSMVDKFFADLQADGLTSYTQDYVDSLCSQIDSSLSNVLLLVRFVNYDGSTVESVYVPYGGSVSCETIPSRPSDEQYHYNFTGWDVDTSEVKSSIVSKAVYEAVHYHSSSTGATCTEDEVCRFCDEVLNEAKGHGKTVLRNAVAVTCETDGYTGDYCCVDCGQVLTQGETITAEGHKYGDWVYYIMPTVTQTGTDRSTCSVCKTSVYRESPKATSATVSDGFIYGLRCNLSPNDVKEYFNTKYLSVSKQSYNGKTMGTNSVISVTQKNVTTNYTVVVFGDVNGDGWYDGQDALIVSCLANGMLTQQDVTPAEFMAADCNHDCVIDESDVALLNDAGLILASVDQSKPESELMTTQSFSEYVELIDQSPETDIPVVEDEMIDNTTEQAQPNLIEMIFGFIEALIKLILSYIPVS